MCDYSPAGHHKLSLLVAVGLDLLWSHTLLFAKSQSCVLMSASVCHPAHDERIEE